MSRGQNLQEMEVGTAQSKTAVNANAKPGMPMDTSVAGSVEDLGGPTPDNYKPDNDSAKLREPKVATVKDVVNRGAKPAMAREEVEEVEEIVTEEEEVTEEIVDETPEYDIEEDMNALFSGEELTEEFQEKAKTIFEAAISAKVAQVAAEMEAKNEERIVEEIETVKSALVERVDSYLEYVADEWLQENELA
ncbi:MAG: T4 prohead core scaffold protein, partial [bacterium]